MAPTIDVNVKDNESSSTSGVTTAATSNKKRSVRGSRSVSAAASVSTPVSVPVPASASEAAKATAPMPDSASVSVSASVSASKIKAKTSSTSCNAKSIAHPEDSGVQESEVFGVSGFSEEQNAFLKRRRARSLHQVPPRQETLPQILQSVEQHFEQMESYLQKGNLAYLARQYEYTVSKDAQGGEAKSSDTRIACMRFIKCSSPLQEDEQIISRGLTFVLQGGRSFVINGERYEAHAGQSIAICADLPSDCSYIEGSASEPYVAISFRFDNKVLNPLFNSYFNEYFINYFRGAADEIEDRFVVSVAPMDDEVYALLAQLCAVSQINSKKQRESNETATLLNLFDSILSSEHGTHIYSYYSNVSTYIDIPECLRYICDNYVSEEPMSDIIRDIASVSTHYFYKRFKAATGMTPLRYRNRIRIMAAKAMIDNGTPIKQAARTVGYNKYLQFEADFFGHYKDFAVPSAQDKSAPAASVNAANSVKKANTTKQNRVTKKIS